MESKSIKPEFDELIASLKLKSSQKRNVQCIPLPIGTFLKPKDAA